MAEEKKILEKIVAISEEFLQSTGSEINYQKISDNILDISGAKYAAFNLFDEDGSLDRTVALSAPDGIVKKVSSLLGFKLLGKKWDHDPVRAEKTKSHTITHFSSLLELVGDVVSKPIVFLLEKTFNIGEVIFVKIVKENIMLGDFTLIMPASVKFKNDNYVEIYTRQVGLLIDRKRAEEALRQRERDFTSMVENATDMIVRYNTELRYVYCNRAVEQQLGISICALIGKTSEEIGFPLEQAKFINKMLSKTLEMGEVQKAEQSLPLPSGQRYFSTSIMPERDASWKIESLLAITRDITDLKLSEEALRESEERYRILSDQSPIAIERYNEVGALMDVNPACLSLFGVTDIKEIKNFDLFADPNISDEHKKKLKQDEMVHYQALFDFEKVKELKLYPTTKSGSVWIDVVITPLKNNHGMVNGYLVHVIDITERKLAEQELKRSNAELERFAYAASHDL